MKVLHSWLAEYIVGLDDHPVGSDPVALGDVMSDIGLCCEEVELLGRGLDGIVVAQVLELAPHPGADRIQLVQVDAGDGEPLQICCGAFNMAIGDRAAAMRQYEVCAQAARRVVERHAVLGS